MKMFYFPLAGILIFRSADFTPLFLASSLPSLLLCFLFFPPFRSRRLLIRAECRTETLQIERLGSCFCARRPGLKNGLISPSRATFTSRPSAPTQSQAAHVNVEGIPSRLETLHCQVGLQTLSLESRQSEHSRAAVGQRARSASADATADRPQECAS
ncbi:uncharacterized protein LY89DRAFT_347738 [Mollisia scopiformis]|uniref:Transmembrane protein n=1 Tax=Mollisia scopiformis TaxID=149040 RepID=A0A132B6I5_MOLSC|nr:uncharacterized protein LY89DRAFT_347738 [Mollisia scopiformis]KUJ08016.1 hypothetical protein LY89DRAFT_347738 [Mollisia scopiformis]